MDRAVASLPFTVTPTSKPSPVIDKLLAKRSKQHSEALKILHNEQAQCNSSVDAEIRRYKRCLLQNLRRLKLHVDREVKNVNCSGHENLLASLRKSQKDSLHLIDGFYESVKPLEQKRVEGLSASLKKAHKKMAEICHLLPYDLSVFFEDEINKTNQFILAQHRSHLTFESKLKQQVEEETKKFKTKIEQIKKKSEVSVVVAPIVTKESYNSTSESTMTALTAFPNPIRMSLINKVPRSMSDLKGWCEMMKTALNQLDRNSKKLIFMYKTAVMQVFNRMFEDLNTVADFGEHEKSDEVLSHQGSNHFGMFTEDVTDLGSVDMEEIQDLWALATKYMESNIENTHRFLNGTAHLWDMHFQRRSECQNLILEDLKKLMDKNNRSLLNSDKKINASVDKLREASTVSNLDRYLHEVNKGLDSVVKLYTKQCDEEIKFINKTRAHSDQCIELMFSEIEIFLQETGECSNIRDRRCPLLYMDMEEQTKSMPMPIKECQMQVEAVNNWMFGLWEALRVYLQSCRKELNKVAEVWFQKVEKKIKKRLDVRLAINKPRYLRIQKLVYDARKKELEEHEKMFRNVEKKTQNFIDGIQILQQNSSDKRDSIVSQFEETMLGIEERLKKATSSLHVRACIEQSATTGRDTYRKLEEEFNDCLEKIEENRSNVEDLILKFSKSLTLFADGGNYHRDEAKSFKKKVDSLKKSVTKKFKDINQKYSFLKMQTLERFRDHDRAILNRQELSKEEFEINEKICAKIKQLRKNIRSFSYEIKFKLHRLNACIDYVSELPKIEIFKCKQYHLLNKAMQECLEKIKELKVLLVRSENEGESYVEIQKKKIDDSFIEIEDIVINFYDNHGAIINKGKIENTSEDFMKIVQKNLEDFRVQVEVHSVECLQEFSNNLVKLLKVNDQVYSDLVKKFPEGVNVEDEEMCKTALEDFLPKHEERTDALRTEVDEVMEFVKEKISGLTGLIDEKEDEKEDESE